MEARYRSTLWACCFANFFQAVGSCFAILYVPLRGLYGLSFTDFGILVSLNFITQVASDVLFSKPVEKYGFRPFAVAAPLVSAAGLGLFAAAPLLFPQRPFAGFCAGMFLFAAAGGLQDRAQVIDGLQVAQAGRVGGGDVHDDKVHPVGERLRAVLVVRGGVFLRCHLVLADVGADDRSAARPSRAQLAQFLGGGICSGVVKAHAVTQAALGHEAPQSRRIVAGLRTRSHSADLDEGVAEGAHAEHGLRVLSSAGREAQDARQAALPNVRGTSTPFTIRVGLWWDRGSPVCAHESARRGESSGQRNRSQTQVVCILRVGT